MEGDLIDGLHQIQGFSRTKTALVFEKQSLMFLVNGVSNKSDADMSFDPCFLAMINGSNAKICF